MLLAVYLNIDSMLDINKGTGGLKGALLPSQSPKFLNDHASHCRKSHMNILPNHCVLRLQH